MVFLIKNWFVVATQKIRRMLWPLDWFLHLHLSVSPHQSHSHLPLTTNYALAHISCKAGITISWKKSGYSYPNWCNINKYHWFITVDNIWYFLGYNNPSISCTHSDSLHLFYWKSLVLSKNIFRKNYLFIFIYK